MADRRRSGGPREAQARLSPLAAFLAGAMAAAASIELAREVRRRLGARAIGAISDRIPPGRRQRASAVAVAFGALLPGWKLFGPVAGLAVSLALAACVVFAGRIRDARRRRDLADSIPGCARSLADSLSAGLDLDRAAYEVSLGGSVAADCLARFASARRGGATIDEALHLLARDDSDGSWAEVAAAISLQRRCGGDLASPLRRVADSADELRESVREGSATTAQARFTASLVCSLPLFVAVGSELILPGSWAGLVESPIAIALVLLAMILQVGSMIAIRWISRTSAR